MAHPPILIIRTILFISQSSPSSVVRTMVLRTMGRGFELNKEEPHANGVECVQDEEAPCGDRTHDRTLTKRMLCQLS